MAVPADALVHGQRRARFKAAGVILSSHVVKCVKAYATRTFENVFEAVFNAGGLSGNAAVL